MNGKYQDSPSLRADNLHLPLNKIKRIQYKLFLPIGERPQSAVLLLLLLLRLRGGATRARTCLLYVQRPPSPSSATLQNEQSRPT